MVADANPGSASSNPRGIRPVVGMVAFAANDGTHGVEPWISGGTATTTSLLADIQPGTAWSAPHSFTYAAGQLFFTAEDGVHGRELWAAPVTP